MVSQEPENDEERARTLEQALRDSGATEDEIRDFLRHVRVTAPPSTARLNLSNWRLARASGEDRRSSG
jgi:hypothetical protein